MTKKDITLLIFSVILIFASIAFIVLFFLTKPYEIKSETSSPMTTTAAMEGFKVSEYDGRIAVYDLQSSQLVEVFDVYLSSLPSVEQNRIRSGIYAEDNAKLQKIIEEYTS